jgi:predicted dehydrogenase
VTLEARPARVGIIGSGNVTHFYVNGCARFASIELAACADLDMERARALSVKGGIPAVTVEALLADPSIDVALVLTPPAAHAAVSIAAIAAGKHVYTEKPLATSRADAQRLLAAAMDAGLRVGAAPDTFLGGGLQTARALIDEGLIGEPLVANAAVAHTGPERWHLAAGRCSTWGRTTSRRSCRCSGRSDRSRRSDEGLRRSGRSWPGHWLVRPCRRRCRRA